MDEDTICNITINSPTDQLIKKCKFIVWDECMMSYKGGIYAVQKISNCL